MKNKKEVSLAELPSVEILRAELEHMIPENERIRKLYKELARVPPEIMRIEINI